MRLRLIITEGPRKGDEFAIKGEITIGRKTGDLPLRDDRASSLHAKISTNKQGAIEIEDLNSSNGTLLNGAKITKALIKAGDRIKIGKTEIQVEEYTSSPGQSIIEKGSWQEKVDGILTEALHLAEASHLNAKGIKFFQTPVALDVVQGIQTGTRFVFGFGPKQVGAHCPEALLFESQAPPIAFELAPLAKGLCEFKTKEKAVLLNGTFVKKQKLKAGDRITIGQTVIVVSPIEKL